MCHLCHALCCACGDSVTRCECHNSLSCNGHSASYRTAPKHGSRVVQSQPAHREGRDNHDRSPAGIRPGAPLGPRTPLAPTFSVYAPTRPCACKPDAIRLCACYSATDTASDTGASAAPLSAPFQLVTRYPLRERSAPRRKRGSVPNPVTRCGSTLASTMGKNGTVFAQNLQITAPRLGRLETVTIPTRRERRAAQRARYEEHRRATP